MTSAPTRILVLVAIILI